MYTTEKEIQDRCNELYYYIEDEVGVDNWNGWVDDFLTSCMNFANENSSSDAQFEGYLWDILPYELTNDDYVWDILLGKKTAEKVRMELHPEEGEEEEEEA